MKRLATSLVLTALSTSAAAQCNEWGSSFALAGADGNVEDFLVWDDGAGPALYVAGAFSAIGDAAGSSVARYDGTSYEALVGPGGGRDGTTEALAAFDDGGGESLFAVGWPFNGAPLANVERWNGSDWVSVGGGFGGRYLFDAVVHGGELYVGGWEPAAGLVASVGRWNGSAWSEVGGPAFDGQVDALAVFDDGSGPAVYAAGQFTQPADHIAKWNGSSWEAVGGGLDRWTRSLAVFDDGNGPALYAGGDSTSAGGNPAFGVARWDGTSWSALGSGYPAGGSLAVHDDGSGPALFAANDFYLTAPFQVVRWDGSTWIPVGAALDAGLRALGSFDDGSGPRLYLGGAFTQAGAVLSPRVARLGGGGWEPTHAGNGAAAEITASTVHDDGSGPKLYANVELAPGSPQVASWDGQAWTPLAGVADGAILDLESYDSGSGPELYAAGQFTSLGGVNTGPIARWNGVGWEALGSGLAGASASVLGLARFDPGSGPLLVAVGDFLTAAGTAAKRVAAWDGTTWTPFGNGKSKPIHAAEVFDSGGGPELHIGGEFVDNVARWNGSDWINIPGGPGHHVLALEVFDDGSGPALYAGGPFMTVAGLSSPRLGRWDGAAWSAVGSPSNAPASPILALRAFDDGSGPALYAGQGSYQSFGNSTSGLPRWDGTSWELISDSSLLTSSTYHPTYATFEVFDDGQGAGPSLFAMGAFSRMDERASGNVARWQSACPCPPVTYCTSKVNSQGCSPSIGWAGTYPSVSQASGFHVTASNTLDGKVGLFFYGYAPKASAFQGGWLCVQSPVKRTALQNSGGTPPCGGLFSFDFNAHMASGADPALAPGEHVFGQYWSRDPLSSFQTNRTDAIEFVICP